MLFLPLLFGDVAQLARALGWQPRGRGFESHLLHRIIPKISWFWGFYFLIMFYTYIIYSDSTDSYYVGSCGDMDKRMHDHLNSCSRYTKKAKDWDLKYYETFATRSEALKRENEIKRKKSRKYIAYLIFKNSNNSG